MANLFFIGTSSGKTSFDRFHSSFLINISGYNLLVDAGDGISKALLKENIKFNSIDGVLITHLHPDHYTGLASLIVQMKMYDRKNDLKIFINNDLEKVVRDFVSNSYLFPDRLGFGINYSPFNANDLFKISDEISFLPKENSHFSSVAESKKNAGLTFSCSSFLFDIGGKKIFYTSDIGSEQDLNLFDDSLPDLFICEITHVKPNVVIKKSLKFNSKLQIIFTHYCDEDIDEVQKFIRNLNENLKSRVILAADGLKIEL